MTLLLILACSDSVFGQSSSPAEHRQFEAAGFGGGSFAGDYHFPTLVSENGGVTSQTVGMNYASGYQFGIRGTENIGDFWAVHLEYSFANQPLRFTNLSPSIPSLSLGHYVHHLSYDGSYWPFPVSKRFRPYAKVGAGTALFYISGHSKDDARLLGVNLRDSWEFAFNWGGGFTHLLEDQVALRFEIKDQITGIPSYGLPRSAQVVNGQYRSGVGRTGLLNSWQLNIGIAYQWDE